MANEKSKAIAQRIRKAYKAGELTDEQIGQLEEAGFILVTDTASVDHLGTVFPTQKAMCEAWGVTTSAYTGRIKLGWTIEEALTGARSEGGRCKSCYDHLGNKYPSKNAMCDAWGVKRSSYNDRIALGWTVGEALTGERTAVKYVDHLENTYPMLKSMCEAWGVKVATYIARIKKGWTVEEALTGARRTGRECFDHLGDEYPDVSAMCEAWGVNRNTYKNRICRGWTVEEALTGERVAVKYVDHLGREYPSLKEMMRHWKVKEGTYLARIRWGWTVEEALTGARRTGRECFDHLGKGYPSKKAMCEAWGVNASTYSFRIKSGWTMEEALTGEKLKWAAESREGSNSKYDLKVNLGKYEEKATREIYAMHEG